MGMVSASAQELQEPFTDLVQWAEDYSLQINVEKAEVIVLGKEGK
jgi:hypothetical protein